MAVEKLIKIGEERLNEKDYLGSISAFSSALEENPKALQPYLKRATAYQNLNNYETAKSDISQAFTIAHERGKRSEIGLCYFKLGLVYYAEKNLSSAKINFEKAVEFNCPEPTANFWNSKVQYEFIKAGSQLPQSCNVSSAEALASREEPPSSNFDVINQQDPIKLKVRDDWYQTNDSIIITFYVKNVEKEKLQVEFNKRSVNVAFPSSPNAEYSYNLDPLFAEITPEDSNFKVYGTKIEIVLKKKVSSKWTSLESSEVKDHDSLGVKSSTFSYPSSSKKSINWAKFKVDEDDEKESAKDSDFFEKLYKDVDDDTKRAMMKSYVESNGTVLTTNWDEAKQKKFETSPPEGMTAKKWN